MMLSKIQRIRSIGNYEDYQATGDVALKKFNFFYAENGAGKTTLASVLRSLYLGESSVIEKRKRMDSVTSPLVEIKLEDNSLCRYPVSGIVDKINDGENGFVASDFSVENYKLLIRRFLKERNQISGDNLYRTFESRFSIQKCTHDYNSLFVKLIK